MLTALLDALSDHAEYYHTAALNAEDEHLKEYLRARSQLSSDFADQLTDAVHASHAEAPAPVSESVESGLRRGLTTVMAAMTIRPEKTDERVLKDARPVDERLLDAYRQAMEDDLPRSVQALVAEQYQQLQAASAYTEARALDDAEAVVLGLFSQRAAAEKAMTALQEAGFNESQLGLMADAGTVGDLLADRRMDLAGASAGVSALGGTFLGGLLGLVAGVGVVLLPGFGPILALSAGAAVLGTTAVGAGIGATYGAFFGSLIGWGIAEEDVHRFLTAVEQGDVLVVVHVDGDNAAQAANVLQRNGVAEVATRTAEQPADASV